MFRIRRFSGFISRIVYTIILLSISLFVIFAFARYLFQTDSKQFVPVRKNSIKTRNQKPQQSTRRVSVKNELNLFGIPSLYRK
jgi:uncharacterized ion transporter superfamily protein YfcC